MPTSKKNVLKIYNMAAVSLYSAVPVCIAFADFHEMNVL